MKEYLNVQNEVLKTVSFSFEYIREIAKDYVYAVTSLLEDAIMEC
jgi:splicing factor 3B subunit 1